MTSMSNVYFTLVVDKHTHTFCVEIVTLMSSVHFTQTVAYNYTHTQSILLKQCRHYDDFSFFKEKDRNFIHL